MRTRSRRQRLAAGAVLATTSLLGTYLVALRPQPTYAAPRGGGVESAGHAAPKLGSFSVSPSIPTCAEADRTVRTPEDLRDAILASQDGYVVCIEGTIELTTNLPTIDDTTITFVGSDPGTDIIDGVDAFAIFAADFSAGSSPSDDDTLTVASLTLTDGRSSTGGGAVRVNQVDPAAAGRDALILDQVSVTSSSSAANKSGGAVFTRAPTQITASTFRGNNSGSNGGAVYAWGPDIIIEGSTFTGNEASRTGGALNMLQSDASIRSTTFSGNIVSTSGFGWGGAISAYESDVTMYGSSVISNQALGATYGSEAGGIYVGKGVLSITNSFLGSNYAETRGGGIAAFDADVNVVLSTVYADSVGVAGAAQAIWLGSSSRLSSIASVVGSSTDDTMITFDPATSSVDDSYSVSTGPQVFTDPTSRTEPAGSLELGPIDASSPGQPGRTPAETSVLVTAAPTTNPTSHLPQPVTTDQLGNPRPTTLGGPFWIGARQAPFVPPNPNPPAPMPAVAPSAPRNVTAEPLDGAAKISWEAPASTGSFPVTYYLVKGLPGSAACLVKSPETECVMDGLTNGQTYSFTVEALNGAGWGAASGPSPAVTPQKPDVSLVLESGPRVPEGRRDRIQATGAALGIPAGTILTPFMRYAGDSTFRQGRAAITVQSDGSFTWSRRIQPNRAVTAYVMWKDTESNRVAWTRVR
jgi:hypothetical protein